MLKGIRWILAIALGVIAVGSVQAAPDPSVCRTSNYSGISGPEWEKVDAPNHADGPIRKDYIQNVKGGLGFFVGANGQSMMRTKKANFCFGTYEWTVQANPIKTGGTFTGPWTWRVNATGDQRSEIDFEIIPNTGKIHLGVYDGSTFKDTYVNGSACVGKMCNLKLVGTKSDMRFYVNGSQVWSTSAVPNYSMRVAFSALTGHFGQSMPKQKELALIVKSFKYTYSPG